MVAGLDERTRLSSVPRNGVRSTGRPCYPIYFVTRVGAHGLRTRVPPTGTLVEVAVRSPVVTGSSGSSEVPVRADDSRRRLAPSRSGGEASDACATRMCDGSAARSMNRDGSIGGGARWRERRQGASRPTRYELRSVSNWSSTLAPRGLGDVWRRDRRSSVRMIRTATGEAARVGSDRASSPRSRPTDRGTTGTPGAGSGVR